MNNLKQSEDLKLKLIQLVTVKGMSIASAARELGVGVRQSQEFFSKEKNWMKVWWDNYEEELSQYGEYLGKRTSEAFGGITPTQYSHPLATEEAKEVYEVYERIMKNVHETTASGIMVQELYQKHVVDNSRILLISDLHIPYHHPDALDFLQHLKDKYKPTRVICLGDEVDHLALSYHEKETDAPSAVDELKMALPVIKELENMFPVMDILDSNHGSLAYRKAKTAGIPKHYLKSYADVLQVGEGWKWHFDMVIDLPHGNSCYLHHGKSSNITKTSQAMSMCAIAGHYHNTFKVEYWANPKGLYWGMQCGCLIDDKSYAFNYNNVNLHRPLIGTGLIIDGLPVLEAMVLNSEGRWVGAVKS